MRRRRGASQSGLGSTWRSLTTRIDVTLTQALLKAVPDRAARPMSSVYSPKMPPMEKVRDKIDPHFRQAGGTL
jgi:hypothetical protein